MAAKKKGKKAAKKAAPKKVAKKPAKKAAKKSGRKPNAAFMKPVMPNDKLAAIVGASPMPRTELTKKLWVYIKKNNLQDKKNRRMINADDKMRALFGGKSSASMFELTKYASRNLK
jgi:chromatin remodeling complex protein RSC6